MSSCAIIFLKLWAQLENNEWILEKLKVCWFLFAKNFLESQLQYCPPHLKRKPGIHVSSAERLSPRMTTHCSGRRLNPLKTELPCKPLDLIPRLQEAFAGVSVRSSKLGLKDPKRHLKNYHYLLSFSMGTLYVRISYILTSRNWFSHLNAFWEFPGAGEGER